MNKSRIRQGSGREYTGTLRSSPGSPCSPAAPHLGRELQAHGVHLRRHLAEVRGGILPASQIPTWGWGTDRAARARRWQDPDGSAPGGGEPQAVCLEQNRRSRCICPEGKMNCGSKMSPAAAPAQAESAGKHCCKGAEGTAEAALKSLPLMHALPSQLCPRIIYLHRNTQWRKPLFAKSSSTPSHRAGWTADPRSSQQLPPNPNPVYPTGSKMGGPQAPARVQPGSVNHKPDAEQGGGDAHGPGRALGGNQVPLLHHHDNIIVLSAPTFSSASPRALTSPRTDR